MFGAITRPIGRLTAKYPKLSYYTTTHFWGPVANWGFVIAVRGRLERDGRGGAGA